MPKTGTTALQQTFASVRKDLRAHNILYPGTEDQHVDLCALFHHHGKNHFYFCRRKTPDPEARAESLIAEVAESDDNIVMSSEYLYDIGAKGAEKLIESFGKYGVEVTLCCYVRHPVDAAVSNAQQAVKMGHRSLSSVVDDPPHICSRRLLEPILAAIGRDRLLVADYKETRAHGIAHHFLSFVGLALPAVSLPVLRVNESLSMDAAILADAHDRYLADHGTKPFSKAFIHKIEGDRFTLPEAAKAKVRAAAVSETDWLHQEFGISLTESGPTSTFRDRISPSAASQLVKLWNTDNAAALICILEKSGADMSPTCS